MSAFTDYTREYDRNPLFRYLHGLPGKGGMSVGQRGFHTHQSRLRALRASNQCLAGDALVDTVDGPRRIDAIHVGDVVRSWRAGEIVENAVTATIEHAPAPLLALALSGAPGFRCTPDHRLLTPTGWRPVASLYRGSALTLPGGGLAWVDGITEAEPAPSFDLTIPVDENYVANGTISHNCGKTYSGAAEAWWHLQGWHPFRVVRPAPVEGWVVIPDLENDWQKISATMRALEPPGILAAGCRYDEAIGYTYRSKRMVMLANRSALYPKSGTQALLALAGRPIDFLWIDEPPKRSHWSEALARVATKFAPVWLTFTPIGRPLGWLRTIMEGNAEEEIAPNPEWVGNQIVIQLSYENAPHRTRQSIDSQIANCDPWELGQRIRAEWDGVTQGRRFGSFTEGCILTDDRLPETFEEIRVHWDHGETEGAQVGYISGRNQRRMYLLREVSAVAHSTPHEDAEAMLKALESIGVHPTQVSRAFGDINSAGKLGAGGNVNAFLESAFADLLRMVDPPFEIERPKKGKGSVKGGEKAMNHAMKEGRWFVHESCVKFINAAKHYTGVEKDLTHPLDAARYGWTDLLLSVPARPGSGVTLVG